MKIKDLSRFFVRHSVPGAAPRVTPEQAASLDAALLQAIEGFDYALITDLIEQGASVNLRGMRDETPLHKAAFAGKAELVSLIIARGADVNAARTDGFTPLHDAAFSGEGRVAALLLAAGANPFARGECGDTPADVAAHEGEMAVAQQIRDAMPLYTARRLKQMHALVRGRGKTLHAGR